MKLSLKVLNPGKMKKDILKAILGHMKPRVKQWAPSIESSIGAVILNALQKSSTVQAIKSGELREEFGLTNPGVIDDIILAIVDSDKLTINGPKISGNNISLRIRYEASPIDLSQYESVGRQVTAKGQSLPWFQWLTTLGDAIIVRDFEVQAGFPNSSRTGDKIMVKGRGWRVPPGHSGSQGNNFITKAIDSQLPEISKILMNKIEIMFS